MSKLYIIDASPIFYKAFFAIPPLNSKNGVPTNAAYGFTNTMINFIKKYKPTHLAVCFDNRSKFRNELYDKYKENRKPMHSSLSVQVPIVKDIVKKMGITVAEAAGYEADDVIGMLTKLGVDAGHEVVIVTPDKDMCQLVSDEKKVQVLDLSKKVFYNEAAVLEKFKVKASQLIDLLSLSGDTVDGIPGVLGIGPGTAVKLISQYENLDGIYANLDNIKGAVNKKLTVGKHGAEISRQLATIICDNKTGITSINQLEKGFIDQEGIKEMFDALNFLSLKDKIEDLE